MNAHAKLTSGSVEQGAGKDAVDGRGVLSNYATSLHQQSRSARQPLSAVRRLEEDAHRIVAVTDSRAAVQLHAERFSARNVRTILRQILSAPTMVHEIAARSYAHENGFIKLVLLDSHYKLRLHYRAASGAAPGAENVHDHRWHLLSSVLLGELFVEKFRTCDVKASDAVAVELCEYVAREPGTSEYGIALVGDTHIRRVSADIYAAGSAYFLHGSVLHRIVTRPGVAYATLVLTYPPFSWKTRLMPADASPRQQQVVPISPSGVSAILHEIIELI